MAYEVLARKWRPQQFDQVVGQQHIAQTLSNAIERDRVAHAYLFVGPRGIGKTSTARIFAKALNCESGPTATPCDQCSSCREIMAGRSLDVIEIDGASNNSVDQVRDLRDSAQYTPTRGPYKLYIIDEVHMLSRSAFNALLKILEEPPAHVKFIFATTEPEKVLTTITSRCQRFDLRRISTQDIMGHLRKIADAEQIGISDKALLAIARGAEGGLRDAESALDQLSSFCGETIEEADVISVFGLVSQGDLEELTTATLQGDIAAVVRTIDQLDKGGRDIRRLVVELIEHFKNLLIFRHSEEAVAVLDVAAPQIECFRRQAGLSSDERVMDIVEKLLALEGRLRYALSPRTLLETTMISSARAATVVSIDEILAKIDQLSGGGSATARQTVAEPKKKLEPSAQPAPEASAKPASTATERLSEREAAAPPKPDTPGRDEAVLERLRREWFDVCEDCAHIAPAARTYLRDTYPHSLADDMLVVGVDAEFYDDQGEDELMRFRDDLQEIVRQRLSRSLGLRFKPVVGISKKIATECLVADADGEKSGKSPREWCQEPVVQETMQVFDGEISDLRI
jgi:DNA polymerase III subunit gamma/tau